MTAKNNRPAPRIAGTSQMKTSSLAGKRSGSATQPTSPPPAADDVPKRRAAPAPAPNSPETAPAAALTRTVEKVTGEPHKTGGRTRKQRTIGIEFQLLDRLRGAADTLPTKVKDQGISSMNDLINHLLNEGMDRYEAEHNKGKHYKAPGRSLRT